MFNKIWLIFRINQSIKYKVKLINFESFTIISSLTIFFFLHNRISDIIIHKSYTRGQIYR